MSGNVPTRVMDETGTWREVQVTGEHPLTLLVNNRELITLMTLGTQPELLAVGWLRNQGFLHSPEGLLSVEAIPDAQTVVVFLRSDLSGWEKKLAKRTVTTGCGQGTVFGEWVEELQTQKVTPLQLKQSTLYGLLRNLKHCNEVYRESGAVHGCALCEEEEVLFFVEDVGRHNAVDKLIGTQLLSQGLPLNDHGLVLSGRAGFELTQKAVVAGAEVVVALGPPSALALQLAQDMGLTLLGFASERRVNCYAHPERIVGLLPAAGD